MPNMSNIDAPLTLVGLGRSGTSLVASILAHHPEIGVTGETVNLIFGVWEAAVSTTGVLSPLLLSGQVATADERAALAVQQVFLTLCPDDKPHWFQKPVGIPKLLHARYADPADWDASAVLYWRVLRQSFPKAHFFTVLRHPCDVVLSGVHYWNYEQAELWRVAGWMAYLLTHPASLVQQAVFYEDLVTQPETTVRCMLEGLKLDYDERVLNAFSYVHAPSQGRRTQDSLTATRRAEWDQLKPEVVRPEYWRLQQAVFSRFGRELEMPAHFTVVTSTTTPAVTAEASNRDENSAETLLAIISNLREQLEALQAHAHRQRQAWKLEADQRLLDAAQAWQAQQAVLQQMQADKEWLDSQATAWHREAERRGQKIEELQAWIAELERAKGWWEEQAQAWQAEVQRLLTLAHSAPDKGTEQ